MRFRSSARHVACLVVLALSTSATILSAGPAKSRKPAVGVVKSAKEAKDIAERETGGKATGARRIPLNGASGGWEVEVQMSGEEKGWRCIIDADTRTVHTKTRIEQPGQKGKSEDSVRLIKGTR